MDDATPQFGLAAEITPRQAELFTRFRRSVFYPKSDIALGDAILQNLRQTKDAAALRHLSAVARLCADLAGRPPRAVEYCAGLGTFHAIYRAALPDGRRWAIRVNLDPESDAELGLHIDAWAMATMARHGLPALRVVQTDTSRTAYPFDFEVIEEAASLSLGDLAAGDPRLPAVLEELGRTLARIHTIPMPGFGLLSIGRDEPDGAWRVSGVHPAWETYIALWLDRHVARCADIGAIRREEAAQIESWIVRLMPHAYNGSPVLLHGDPGSHNVFTDGAVITAIIDWEDSLSGDPIYDVAFWGTFHPDDRLQPFLKGYGSVTELGEDFAVRYWLYYLRIALAKTVHRSRFGYQDAPGRQPASTRIQKGLARLVDACELRKVRCASF